jgi:hypothetical protein
LTFCSLICCQNRKDNEFSKKFYQEYRLDFLQSDLTKYAYNPRLGFSNRNFRVLILNDSAIRVTGTKRFNQEFSLSIDTLYGNDVVIKALLNVGLAVNSAYSEIMSEQVISKDNFIVNPVIYFQNLKKQINSYNIIAIEGHLSVNIFELIFSDHDYLIYKPDSLVFSTENKDFMKYLFKEGLKLDNNWYQFKAEKNIDYN